MYKNKFEMAKEVLEKFDFMPYGETLENAYSKYKQAKENFLAHLTEEQKELFKNYYDKEQEYHSTHERAILYYYIERIEMPISLTNNKYIRFD